MKMFVAYILTVTTMLASIFCSTSVCTNWEPSPSPSPWVEYGTLLDKQVYSTDSVVLQVTLSGYFDISNYDSVTVEIVRKDMDDLVFSYETMEATLTIDINLQPGEYLLRAYTYRCGEDTYKVITPFSVVGMSDLFFLTTETITERFGDTDYLIGINLKWDWPADGGPYTLTRVNSYGEVKIFNNITRNQFFDGEVLPGTINTYTVSNGKRSSSPAAADLRGFPPLEYAGNKNDKIIVLKIGDPYMYTAKDKQSAMYGQGLKRLGPIYWDDLGVVPKLINNRTMVPLAALVHQMGGMVAWDGKKRIVTIRYDGNVVEIPIGSHTVYLNSQKQSFDTPARIERSRTLVPIRHLELLNCEVTWVGKTRSVILCYKGI